MKGKIMKSQGFSKRFLTGVFCLVFYVYLLVAIGSALHFNWQYATEKGFVKWLCFGEIVATAKAVVWPYYVFSSTPVDRYDSPYAEHFFNSKKAYEEAVKEKYKFYSYGDAMMII